jgi:cysteinyl-tRNA synthetase
MTIRFFILQAHYRSTLDFSNEALQAAEKGFHRLLAANETLKKLKPSDASSVEIEAIRKGCYDAMNDDFNSPQVIATLFEGVRLINQIHDGKETISANDLALLIDTFNTFVVDVLGLLDEVTAGGQDNKVNGLMDLILQIRQNARTTKDWGTSDLIRDELKSLSIQVKDTKEGPIWSVED